MSGLYVLFFLVGGTLGWEEDAEANPKGYKEWLSSLEERPLDLNRASVRQLSLLPGISEELAERIERRREQVGGFEGPEELLRVEGMDEETLDGIRPYVTCGHKVPFKWKLRAGFEEGSGYRARMWLVSGNLRAAFSGKGPRGYISWGRGPLRAVLGDFRPGFGQGLLFSHLSRSFEGMGRMYRRPCRSFGCLGRGSSLRGIFLEGRLGHTALRTFSGGTSGVGLEVRLGGYMGGGVLTSGGRGSLYGTFPLGPYTSFWEVADFGGLAWVVGASLRAGVLRTEVLVRRYDPGFRPPYGAGYGYPGRKGGEGVSWGASFRLRKGWYLESYVDLHRSYLPSAGDRLPSGGALWSVEGRGKIGDLKVRFRARGSSFRGEASWSPEQDLALRCRIERVWGRKVGYSSFWEVKAKVRDGLSLEGRWTTFDLPEGLRIYELEGGPRGDFPLAVWTGRGCRGYILLRWSYKGHDLWLRLGRTFGTCGRTEGSFQVQWEASSG